MPRDEATVLDLINAAKLALKFVEGSTRETFFEDAKTQASVLYQITLIGEAARRLSEEFRARHTEIPWRLILGMRNRLIHEYDDVDLNEVWKTLQRDIPDLLKRLASLPDVP